MRPVVLYSSLQLKKKGILNIFHINVLHLLTWWNKTISERSLLLSKATYSRISLWLMSRKSNIFISVTRFSFVETDAMWYSVWKLILEEYYGAQDIYFLPLVCASVEEFSYAFHNIYYTNNICIEHNQFKVEIKNFCFP